MDPGQQLPKDVFAAAPPRALFKRQVFYFFKRHLAGIGFMLESAIADGRLLTGGHRERNSEWISMAVQVHSADHSALWDSDPIEDTETDDDLFFCPITLSRFSDPVVASDGITYERSAIETWLKQHDTSPLTGEVLSSILVYRNIVLKNMLARQT